MTKKQRSEETWRKPDFTHGGRAMWWQSCNECQTRFASDAPEPSPICKPCYQAQMISHMREHNVGIFTSLTAKIAYQTNQLTPNGDQSD